MVSTSEQELVLPSHCMLTSPALKIVGRPALSEDQYENQLFEAQIHLSLPIHTNIVTLHETLQTNKWLFLMLEWCPGDDLYVITNLSHGPELTSEQVLLARKQQESYPQGTSAQRFFPASQLFQFESYPILIQDLLLHHPLLARSHVSRSSRPASPRQFFLIVHLWISIQRIFTLVTQLRRIARSIHDFLPEQPSTPPSVGDPFGPNSTYPIPPLGVLSKHPPPS